MEENKIILEFLDYKVSNDQYKDEYGFWIEIPVYMTYEIAMEAVEIIESFEFVHNFMIMNKYAAIGITQSPRQITHRIESSKTVTEFMNVPGRPNATKTYTKQMDSKLEAIYYCILEFIKWYNEH